MPEYRLVVIGEQETETAVKSTPKSKVVSTPNAQASKNGGDAFAKNLGTQAINRTLINPLNSATGGLASPVYEVSRGLMKGGGLAAVGGGLASLAITAVFLAVTTIEKRVAKMEAKAEEMNNKDNALIRAGAKSSATFYSGSLKGVQKTNRS